MIANMKEMVLWRISEVRKNRYNETNITYYYREILKDLKTKTKVDAKADVNYK